jgi:hypothetical protein
LQKADQSLVEDQRHGCAGKLFVFRLCLVVSILNNSLRMLR